MLVALHVSCQGIQLLPFLRQERAAQLVSLLPLAGDRTPCSPCWTSPWSLLHLQEMPKVTIPVSLLQSAAQAFSTNKFQKTPGCPEQGRGLAWLGGHKINGARVSFPVLLYTEMGCLVGGSWLPFWRKVFLCLPCCLCHCRHCWEPMV